MKNSLNLFVFAMLIGFSGSAWAGRGEANGTAQPLDSAVLEPANNSDCRDLQADHWKLGTNGRFQFAAGTQMLMIGHATDVAPAIGLTLVLPGSPWSFEAGGAPSHTVGGNFRQVQATAGGTSFDARIEHLWEAHVTANYTFPLGGSKWVVPDAGFGVSMVSLTNRIDTMTSTGFGDNEEVKYSFSPLFCLGLTFFPGARVNLHLEAAYVGYADTFMTTDPLLGNSRLFDLGFSGVLFRTMLQVHI